jgi:hypothetical protein
MREDMRRILALFRKDVRHLWPQAAAVSILMALAAVLDPTYSGHPASFYDTLSGMALPLACFLLVLSVIHQEKLPGTRQYWLTRPYRWTELLASKVLFVAVFIHLPLAIYHVAVFAAVGVPIADHVQALLWRQFFFTAFYILPVAALAALTRSLGRALLLALAVVAGVSLSAAAYLFLTRRPLLHLQDANATTTLIRAVLLAAGVCALLGLQYARRRTALAGWLAVAVALAVVGPPSYGLASRRNGTPHPHASLVVDAAPNRNTDMRAPGDRDILAFDLPVRLVGAPSGAALDQPYLNLRIDVPGRRYGWRMAQGQLHGLRGGLGWLNFSTDRRWFDQLADQPAVLSGSVDLLLFDNVSVLPLPRGQAVAAPGVGPCRDGLDRDGGIVFRCLSPAPRAVVMVGIAGLRANWIVTPGLLERSIPTASGFQPLQRFVSLLSYRNWREIGDAELIAAEPLPPVRLELQTPPVRLRDYLVQ